MSKYKAIIAGTGCHLPEKRLTNDDISRLVATDDEWIVQRTGIRERRIAGPTETTATLASHAATNALKSAGLEPKDLDLIIVATATPEMMLPSTGCFVAASLGLDETPAFDIAAACSGFLFALDTATAYIQAGRYKNIMVIGAETLTRITDYTDRSSCILFGDGAGAVVLQQAQGGERGVMHTSLHSDGHGWDFIYCSPGSRHPIDSQLIAARNMFMKLKGREVYKFAVDRFTGLIQDAMDKCSLKRTDIKLIIPHQVNQRIIDSSLEKLGFNPETAFVNIAKYGNTSSASIPIALDEAMKAGRLMKGDVAVFVAFGAGLTWANAVVRI